MVPTLTEILQRAIKRRRSVLLAGMALLFSGCLTNYSYSSLKVSAPILLQISLNPSAPGYLIQIAAQNSEVGFSGYRLFQGISEDGARNADPLSGIDCSTPLANLPVRGIPYYIEANPTSSGPQPNTLDHLCNVQLALTSGTWVALRSVLHTSLTASTTSISSNALPVP